MATLNSFQKISRVLTGQPFGDGADGSATISSDPNTRATITGTATQNTGTAGSTAFANGDLVILYQTQGTGAGQWEANRVASGGGTTSLVFQVAHNYTYGTGAQIIKVPRYTTATLGSFTVTAWNGTTGGVGVVVGHTSISGSGTVTLKGIDGAAGSGDQTGGQGCGFRGGNSKGGDTTTAYQGESSVGVGSQSTSVNGTAGGGGYHSTGTGGGEGGGGGYGTSGTTGTTFGGTGGAGGSTTGSADLTTIFLGVGGGGSSRSAGALMGAGGGGGGILILISESIDISSATITSNGGNGGTSDIGYGYGGCGSGGSILIVGGNTVTLGTTKATAIGGYLDADGAGGDGRISVHHKSVAVSGTTDPTFNDTSDPSLMEDVGSYLFMST